MNLTNIIAGAVIALNPLPATDTIAEGEFVCNKKTSFFNNVMKKDCLGEQKNHTVLDVVICKMSEEKTKHVLVCIFCFLLLF